MIVKDIRVEERLIHGQVVTRWLQALKPDRIIVVDDEVSQSDFQKQMLKIATPQGYKLSIFGVDRCIERLAENPYGDEAVFFLIKDVDTVKRLLEKGMLIEKVNIGNIGGKEGKQLIKQGVSMSKEEMETVLQMYEKGVQFRGKMVPEDPDVDIIQLIRKEL